MPIVKIKTYKKPKFEYLLRYMLDGKERLLGADGKSFVLTHNLRGKTIDGWVKQFQENETHRLRKRKNSVYLNHEIISFHRDSTKHLTMEKLELLVREYIRLRGNAMVVATAHFDKFHVHLHLCTSAIEYRTGKSMRMSRSEFATLKKDLQQYQVERFPELSKSVVRHGRKTKGWGTEKEMQFKLRTGKMSKREMVKAIVAECYRKAKSEEEFYEMLKTEGMETYVRGGRVYGVVFEKRKVRFKKLGIETKRMNKITIEYIKELTRERNK